MRTIAYAGTAFGRRNRPRAADVPLATLVFSLLSENPELDATVLRPSVLVRVAGDRLALAEAFGPETRPRNAAASQVVRHRIRATFGQPLIVCVRPHRVGVACDRDANAGLGAERIHRLVED